MKDKLKKALKYLRKAMQFMGELVGLLEKATKEAKPEDKK